MTSGKVHRNIEERANEFRRIRSSGSMQSAVEGFLSLFNNGTLDDRCYLVRDFPEFFEGGQGGFENISLEVLSSPEVTLISQTSFGERAGLLGLTLALRPLRSLEVGRARGGATVVLSVGCLASEGARFVSLDPNYSGGEHCLNNRLREKLIQRGVVFYDFASPAGIPAAASAVGGDFDFVFIDADHDYDSVLADLNGVLPFLATDAYVVLHDANYPGVADAVCEFVYRTGITDCGRIGRDQNESQKHLVCRGKPVLWGGLHLLRNSRQNSSMSVLGKFFSKLSWRE